jgi:hypothetical protein
MRTGLAALVLAILILFAPTAARAEWYGTAHNGATCIPYPHASTTAVPYQSFLYGFRNMAFCHIVIPNTWMLDQLSYVLYTVNQGGPNPMRISLCVTDAYGGAPTCGSERTTGPGLNVNWVTLPAPLPGGASLAYLQVIFPAGEVSRVFEFAPAFYRP